MSGPLITMKTTLLLIAGLAGALQAWTPAPRPGFKLDTLDASNVLISYDSLGRFSDSSSAYTEQSSGGTVLNKIRYQYEGTSRRLVKRIHFNGTPEHWYSGERTYDTGYVRRDSQGRDSCMDISGMVISSYGSVGGDQTRISRSDVIRWNKLGRVIYDGTQSPPMSYGYDDHGRVTYDSVWYSTKKPTFKNAYRYDDAGRLIFQGGETDTVLFQYSPEGWRTYTKYAQGKPKAWATVEQRADTAFFSYGRPTVAKIAGVTWYLKDAWGDTIEEGTARTDSGFKITYIQRDSITRDKDGNALLVRSFKGETLASLQLSKETRYVWSKALPGTGISNRSIRAGEKIARIEWCDLQGRVLASTDKPSKGLEPQHTMTRLTGIVERSLSADGRLVSSKVLLTR